MGQVHWNCIGKRKKKGIKNLEDKNQEVAKLANDTESTIIPYHPRQQPVLNPTTIVETPETTPDTILTKKNISPPIPPPPRVVTPYCFLPLRDGHIRLLRLHPNSDVCAPIQCDLIDHYLLDPDSGTGPHLFEALSYVWGSSTRPHVVHLETGYLPVTENLHAALLHLRDHALPRIVWADAICINQDDARERSAQVGLMAAIYSKATRVLVWLEDRASAGDQFQGHTLADSGPALEVIRAAAEGQSANPQDYKLGHRAIRSLFERSWFRHIWVLQEVSVARQILMISHSTEIDGYAFCLGLSRLGFASDDADIQNCVRSTIHVIKGANYRPKCVNACSDGPSPNTRPLAELINMYHDREATDRRDKIYALLGLSSDNGSTWDLSADYEISWQDLFYRVVRSLVGSEASVATWSEDEVAIINTKGAIFGKVSSVLSGGDWGDQQVLEIRLNPMIGSHQSKNWTFGQRVSWTLPNTAKSIQKDDVVWILQGSSNATFIRLCEDYCEVIAMAVDPPDDSLTKQPFNELLSHLQSTPIFSCNLPLIWDWKIHEGENDDRRDYECFLQSRVPECADINLEEPPDTAARLHSIGLVLRELGESEKAAATLGMAITAYDIIPASRYSQIREAVNCSDPSEGPMLIASVFGREKDGLGITEDHIASIAKLCDVELMGLLLDQRGDEIQITERVLRAAASNTRHGVKVMKTLLERKGDGIAITEGVLDTVATNKHNGAEMMKHLLNLPSHQVPINEAVLKAAVSNNRWDNAIVELLFDRQGGQITLTEEVVKAAVGNPTAAKEMTGLLLDRRGAEVVITDAVLKAAVGNRCHSSILEYLFDRRGEQIRNSNTVMSEDVVKAAISNPFEAERMISVLFDRCGDAIAIAITEDVLKAAVSNPGDPCKVLEFLFNRPKKNKNQNQNQRITVTEDVVKAAVGNRFKAEEVMRLLFDHRGAQVPITEGVIKAAVTHLRQAEKLLALFFDRRGDRIVITDEVLRTVENREKNRYRLFKLIGERSGIPVDHFLCKYRE